jgi:ribosomal protein L11 methylase PrmA
VAGARPFSTTTSSAAASTQPKSRSPLIREFVELFSDPDDVVLDPFCGSGTSLVAALERGRRAIGIDIDEKALRIARARCEAVLGQGSLFGAVS